MNIKYKREFKPVPCPVELTGELQKAWSYLNNCEGVCTIEQFDDDWAPAGLMIREKLAKFGVLSSTSGKSTIIFFDQD